MGVSTDVLVVELAPDDAAEPGDVWPTFERTMESVEAVPVRRWTHGSSLYVVFRDPGPEIFSALAKASGVEISNAANLELTEELRAAGADIEECLPTSLDSAIEFPEPPTLTLDSIERESAPLIICPDPECPDKIHPPGTCPNKKSRTDSEPPAESQPPAPAP
jgi:hypothetical protein